MEENFASRLKLFIDSIGVSSTKVADLCDIPRPSFSQLLSGRNQKVSDVLIGKIHKAYPDLSVTWLMFGEGPMLKSEQRPSEEPSGHNGEKTSAIPSENPETRNVGQSTSGYSNVNGLTSQPSTANDSVIQQLEQNKRILELQMQIDKLKEKPRRVTKITVYYDDLTYETFVPEK